MSKHSSSVPEAMFTRRRTVAHQLARRISVSKLEHNFSRKKRSTGLQGSVDNVSDKPDFGERFKLKLDHKRVHLAKQLKKHREKRSSSKKTGIEVSASLPEEGVSTAKIANVTSDSIEVSIVQNNVSSSRDSQLDPGRGRSNLTSDVASLNRLL